MKYKIILFLLLSAVIISAGSGRPKLSPWDAWRMAYTSFEQGEEAREKGDYTKARQAFDKALEYYNMVRESRPDWNQKVISERIAECQSESRRMSALLGPAEKKSAPESGKSSSAPLFSKADDQLRKELAAVKAELEELKRKTETQKNYEDEISNLLRDQRLLHERYALLEKRYRAQSEKLALPDKRVKQLESQLVALRLQLDLAAKENSAAAKRAAAADAERITLRKEKQNADSERKKLAADMEELRKEISRKEKEISAITQERESARRNIADLERSLTESRSSSSKLSDELSKLQVRYREKLAASGAGAAANKKLLEENRRLQESNNAFRRDSELNARQKAQSQQEMEKLRKEIGELQSRNARSEAQLKESRSRVDSLNAELAREKANTTIINRELETMRSNVAASAAELKKLSTRNSELAKRLKFRESEDFKNMTAARSEKERLQKELNKQEENAAALRAEVKTAKDKLAAVERAAKEMNSENRKLHAGRIELEDRLKALSGVSASSRDLSQKYAELQKNFRALQTENRQNKLAAEAAKPREAELARIKLRLAELDGLKQQLRREQSFNEQLNAVKNRLERELRQLRPMGEENTNLKLQLADHNILKKEVERLRKLSKELAEAQKLSVQVTELKMQLARSAPEAAEAAKLRRQNKELTQGRVLWENEIAKMKLQLASMEQLQQQHTKLKGEKAEKERDLQAAQKEIASLNAIRRELTRQAAEYSKLRTKTRQMAEDHASTIEKLKKAAEEIRHLKVEMAHRTAKINEYEKMKKKEKAPVQDRSADLELINRLRKENSLLRSLNDKNVDLEQNLAVLQVANNRMRNELENLRPVKAEVQRLSGEMRKCSAELDKAKKENNQLLQSAAEGRRIAAENSSILKINKELSDRSLKAESALAALKSELADFNRLRTEVERLRKLTSELASASNLAPQLAQAKLRIARLEQLREELDRQRALNEELTRKKSSLEKELAARPMPAFAPADYTPVAMTKPVGKAEDYISAAKIASADDKIELAIWNCRTALQLAPDNTEAAEMLGKLLVQQGDFAGAAPLLSKARNAKPSSIELALETANAYIALKRYGNADAIIAPLLKRNRENPRLQMAAALIAAGNGEHARAAGLMRLAAARQPKDPEPLLELARLLYNTDSRRVYEAVKLYEQARRLGASPDLELEPKLAHMLNKRQNMTNFLTSAAREAARSKDWNSVIWYNRQLIDLDREPEKYRPRLAFAQYKKGSSSAALETLSMGSPTPLSLLVKAFIHQQRKEERESIQCLRQAKSMSIGKPIELPADWGEFIVDFRKYGKELTSFAQ